MRDSFDTKFAQKKRKTHIEETLLYAKSEFLV
jgi:hypothetical protein